MAKKNSKNNDFLKEAKEYSNQKIYSLILGLVNENREELAEDVYKVDYLLRYVTTSAKDKDFIEAKDALNSVKIRIKKLKAENVDIDHLEYLVEILLKNYPKLNPK